MMNKHEQRALGARIVAPLDGLPEDQRLVVLIAVVYGEGRNQGLGANALTALFSRLVRIHEQGGSHLNQIVRALPECPTCGRQFGGDS